MRKFLLVLTMAFPVWVAGSVSCALDADLAGALTAGRCQPKGEYYDATVPDTLDLAERARLTVHGLTSFLNSNQNYAPYGQAWFNVRVPYMTSKLVGGSDSGAPNWGKITEALVMARVMSGSRENLGIDGKTFQGMVRWMPDFGTVPSARAMHALMAMNQINPDPKFRETIGRLASSFRKSAKQGDTGVVFYEGDPIYDDGPAGQYGYGAQVRTQGDIMRALTRWYELSGDRSALELAGEVARYTLQFKPYWTAEAEPKAVVGLEHAHFNGHPHENCVCLMGLLRYAQAVNNARIKQFVRDGYEYLRNWGIARIGLFGEMCAVSDMTYLAIKLSDYGVGDYWEDVDCYVRNILADRQITSAEKLRQAVATEPILARFLPRNAPNDPINNPNAQTVGLGQNLDRDAAKKVPLDPAFETEDNVVERCVGTFLSDAGYPSETVKIRMIFNICCPGNANHALFYAWESIVRCDEHRHATINLLLNRASQWLDIDSYLPYQGKVVIRNKSAASLAVRIPRWVDRNAIKTEVNDRPAVTSRVGSYQLLPRLKPGDTITISFPMVETHEQYTLKWRREGWWMEGTNPGSHWTNDHPEVFTLYFKGNTLLDLTPRPRDSAYPSFQRDEYKRDKAPMIRVKRFVSAVNLTW
jgi:hypothetical protein